ncbi:hypothetical protein [Halovivax gelatinilyticus]|uniref:hypothetical protein n=1 Tax=Halovivax gelatinilyticus TaxID=2961597 RepID=UPI0020CA2D95|nr:hypothetical protein [Halovivax gelatinilyticus]
MFVCSECESAQFLQIVESAIEFDTAGIRSIDESYQCTFCGERGRYTDDGDAESVSGSIRRRNSQPRTTGQHASAGDRPAE